MGEFIPNPAPRPISYLDEQFWAHCADGVLAFQCCSDCETWRHIPRFMCANCGSEKWAWRQSSGRGVVYSWTVCHMPMSPEFIPVLPYAVLVVELQEGVRMTAGLRDLEHRDLTLGLPVEVLFEPLENGGALPFFRPRRDPTTGS
jgi:uncharacterized OB-fold protein